MSAEQVAYIASTDGKIGAEVSSSHSRGYRLRHAATLTAKRAEHLAGGVLLDAYPIVSLVVVALILISLLFD